MSCLHVNRPCFSNTGQKDAGDYFRPPGQGVTGGLAPVGGGGVEEAWQRSGQSHRTVRGRGYQAPRAAFIGVAC